MIKSMIILKNNRNYFLRSLHQTKGKNSYNVTIGDTSQYQINRLLYY